MIEKKMSFSDYNIEDFVCDNSFVNFAKNNNQIDVEKWEKWLSLNPNNKEAALNAKILILHLRFKKEDLSSELIKKEWLKLSNKLKLKDTETPLIIGNVFRRKAWRYVAAACVILLTAGSIYFFNSNQKCDDTIAGNEIIAPKGQIKQVLLPDGSLVYLNADSKLKYNNCFNEDFREVFLEGEAYFDVKHNSKSPFIVHAQGSEIRVLGTAFNVFAYPGENTFMTSLERGKVSISRANEKTIELKVNQSYLLLKNNNQSKVFETANIESYSSWKNGKIVLRNQQFTEILRILGRSYNVTFELQNKDVGKFRYTGTFCTNDDINTILGIIKLPSPFEYEILGDTVVIK